MSQPDRLARSARELEAARLVLGQGFTEQACGHAYYAAFYAVQEALIAAGRSAKTHSGTLSAFGELLQERRGPTDAGRVFSRLHQTREETTYRWMGASPEEAEDAIAKAQQVIATAKELISQIDQGPA